jgi:hypothetical protein
MIFFFDSPFSVFDLSLVHTLGITSQYFLFILTFVGTVPQVFTIVQPTKTTPVLEPTGEKTTLLSSDFDLNVSFFNGSNIRPYSPHPRYKRTYNLAESKELILTKLYNGLGTLILTF